MSNLPHYYATRAKLFDEHPWLHELAARHPDIHPAVGAILGDGYKPKSMKDLALACPYESVKQPGQLAYVESIAKGQADRQTVTRPGRFITKHFSGLSDDYVRDKVALHSNANHKFELLDTVEDMIRAVMTGPQSCMKWSYMNMDEALEEHPYRAYDPKLGWKMAIHKIGDEIWGRCLVLEREGHKCFVRSFFQDPKLQGYSNSGTHIEAWLKDQGYDHYDSWPSKACIAHLKSPKGYEFLAPYIDGHNQGVVPDFLAEHGDVLRICHENDDGAYECCNTDGGHSDRNQNDDEEYMNCEQCGDRTHYDDMTTTEAGNGIYVCDHCLCAHFTFVQDRDGYWPEGEVGSVTSSATGATITWVLNGDAPDEVVVDVDGDWAHYDDVVFIESDSEYYPMSDRRIVYIESKSEYFLREECVKDTAGCWFHDDECIEVDGHGQVPPSMAVELPDGSWIHINDAVVTASGGMAHFEAVERCAFDGLLYLSHDLSDVWGDGKHYRVSDANVDAFKRAKGFAPTEEASVQAEPRLAA